MQKYKIQVICLENLVSITINQQISEQIIPLISYYSWPVSEAWEQINNELESKFWIPENEKIMLLNLLADIINVWKQQRLNLSEQIFVNKAPNIAKNIKIVGLP